jgi:hypothetical protein
VNDYSRCVGPSERGAGSAVNAQDASQPATGSTQVDGQAAGISRERALQAQQGEVSDAKCLCGGVSTRWLALDGKPAIHIRHEISETMLVEEYKVVPDSLLAALASSGAKG